MNSIGLSIVAFVFVLGVMIFIHELGHYLMAKYLGIRVDVFSLGFGPRIFGFRKGDTDYRVSVLPLGGYVKMAGESYEEELTGVPEEFMSHAKIHRFWVAVSGPLMNIGLALILVAVNYMLGVQIPRYYRGPALLSQIEAGSPAAKAGLQFKDKIIEVEGNATPSWQDFELAIGTNPNRSLTLTIERNGQIFKKEVVTAVAKRAEIGTIGVSPFEPYVINEVEPGSPAARAGLQPGDLITQVRLEDKAAYSLDDIPQLISSSKGRVLQFQVKRGGEILEKTITPIDMRGQVRVGIKMDTTLTEKYGFFKAMGKAFENNYQLTLLTFDIVGKIITGDASLRTMSGPIEIARFSGEAASLGAVYLMRFMALISLQLGIFNLLPIPILDGGVIALLAFEGLIRRDLSLKVKERISQVGFIFLILLMGIVLFNDLSKNLPNL